MTPALQHLRQQLREKFPDAHQSRTAESRTFARALPDFPRGALSELSPAGPASGLALVLSQLLTPPDLRPSTPTLALIDGRDSFDPASHGPAACARLLWLRCHHAAEALRCADLLLRDGNLPLLVLDLHLNPLPELGKIPSSSWHRLRTLARESGATLLALTPHPLIPATALQLTLASTFQLHHLESTTSLTETLRVEGPMSQVASRRTAN